MELENIGNVPDLCAECTKECKLLNKRQAYEKVFQPQMKSYEKLKALPDANIEEINKKMAGAALDRSDFVAELRSEGQGRLCPFRGEF